MKIFVKSSVFCLSAASTLSFSLSSTRSSTRTNTALYAANDKKRVVVTGLGVISGCGIGADDFFQACVDGKSSIRKVKRFDIQYYPCQIASEVPEEMFVAADHFANPKNAKSNDRFTHFAVAAARQALKDAGMGDTPQTLENPERVGVMVGSAFGGMETFEQETLKLAKKPERPKVGLSNAWVYGVLPRASDASVCSACDCRRFLLSRFRHCLETQHRVSSALNVAAKDRTTESSLLVQVAATQSERRWE